MFLGTTYGRGSFGLSILITLFINLFLSLSLFLEFYLFWMHFWILKNDLSIEITFSGYKNGCWLGRTPHPVLVAEREEQKHSTF